MQIQKNLQLASFTSLNVGGAAEIAVTVNSSDDITEALALGDHNSPWLMGYGSNLLVSDRGLPGITLMFEGGDIHISKDLLIADAGVWWDDVVTSSISGGLWGLELMSGIPGGVGGAVVGNIAAYGQAISHTLDWIDVWDDAHIRRMQASELKFGYRSSLLQQQSHNHLIVLRAAFRLSRETTGDVSYQRALDIAQEHGYDLRTRDGRRQAVLHTRRLAGSLWDYRDQEHQSHTAGSFFRNPLVTAEQAEHLITYDESGKTASEIHKMNQIHGGDATRVSAAHILLAAGFQRGQSWGRVRLHPDHVLKIETLPGATAQAVYDVATEIVYTVRDRLGIELQPEPRFLGEF